MTDFKAIIAAAVNTAGSQQKFAEDCGVSQQQISYLLNEAKEISPRMALKIELATKGKVRREALRPDIFASPRRVRASSPERAAS